MKKNPLYQFENIPVDSVVLESLWPYHRAPKSKVLSSQKKGALIRLKRGLYVVSPDETDKDLSLGLIANHLYGPSYVSRQWALRYYGLIPEHVYLVSSMTIKHSREFRTPLANFRYRNCSEDWFSIGIRQEQENGVNFLIASPEKALCDTIVCTPKLNLRYKKEILTYLEEDIRFYMEDFVQMDPDIFDACARLGRKAKMLSTIANIIRHEQ